MCCLTSQAIAHEDFISQRVTQNHAHKLPVPGPFDVLAAFAAAVSRVVLEGERDPDWFSTCKGGKEETVALRKTDKHKSK